MGHEQRLRRLERDVGELLARHDVPPSEGRFAPYTDDPCGFIEAVLGETDPGLWSAQREIAEAFRDTDRVAVRSCNGLGKDFLVARLALWGVYVKRALCLLTGPTQRQVEKILMRGEIARAFRRADLPGTLYTRELRLGGGVTEGILAFTSTEAGAMTGFHHDRVYTFLTEAQAIENFGWEAMLANMSGSEDRILAVGNPLVPEGRFYQVAR